MIVKENLNEYCSRIEQACSEFLNFRKDEKKRLKKEHEEKKLKGSPLNIGNQKFYDNHIDKVNEILQKHNISEKSLSNICKN
jgi:phenylalanyl-tRNA synthetase alpha subunit